VCSGTVDEVLPRRSELQDPAVANVDQVLLVFALERPPLDLRTATRWDHTSTDHTTCLFNFSLFVTSCSEVTDVSNSMTHGW
jgi:hypothetical protein